MPRQGSARASTSRRRRRPITGRCCTPLWMVRCDGLGRSRRLRLRLVRRRSKSSFTKEGEAAYCGLCLFSFKRCSGEMSRGDGDGGDGCGFSAEDARAEGDGLPFALGEERHFFGGPAAFG